MDDDEPMLEYAAGDLRAVRTDIRGICAAAVWLLPMVAVRRATAVARSVPPWIDVLRGIRQTSATPA